MIKLRTICFAVAIVSGTIAHVSAEQLTIGTWNLEGPAGLDGRDAKLRQFADFVAAADAIVIQETLGSGQMTEFLGKAQLNGWSFAVSDFSNDDRTDPYQKLEVAVISPHRISAVSESDPYDRDDSDAAKETDRDVIVPAFIPESQRGGRGSRGWLWVEFEELKLVVAAVHLKSSQGRGGRADEENSHKREAIAAALAQAIVDDQKARPDWSHIVAGDFNVAPGDIGKVGVALSLQCSTDPCTGYDQTHAIFGGGITPGLAMRNLVEGLSASYAKGNYVQSPIDNIYAAGPIFDRTTFLSARRGDTFGSDHYALIVSVE